MVRLIAAIVAGWLTVMTGTTQTLAVRVRDVVVGPGWEATYAAIAAGGWVVSIGALVLAGLWHDRALHRPLSAERGTDLALLRSLPLLLVAAALGLAVAASVTGVALAWFALQVPAAMLITVASARLATQVPPGRRWLAAALTGASPGMSLALGSATVVLAGPGTPTAVVAPAVLAAVLAAPALWRRPRGSTPPSLRTEPTAMTTATHAAGEVGPQDAVPTATRRGLLVPAQPWEFPERRDWKNECWPACSKRTRTTDGHPLRRRKGAGRSWRQACA